MIEERRKGNYSSIRYDKLIINNCMYKYDEFTQQIVNIGQRRTTTQSSDLGNVHGRSRRLGNDMRGNNDVDPQLISASQEHVESDRDIDT
ncbi:hypothetical protein DPMN_177870 [Dreissena polymorpha]|uniref:Uncharacterized protein n=1 Tax=Dreissena polymorpha TaxID=45954 RepID=A0A9D4EDU7_DREPO|nr:hypothetical protein DPMN_177870 [Dreissena polymorpha]